MEYRESGIEQRNFSISGRLVGGVACLLLFSTVFPSNRCVVIVWSSLERKERGRERERGEHIFSVFIFSYVRFTTKEQLTYVNIRIYAANDSFVHTRYFILYGEWIRVQDGTSWPMKLLFPWLIFHAKDATIWPVNGYITENTVELKEKGADDNRMEIRWKLRRWQVKCCFLAKLIGRKEFDDWKIQLGLKLKGKNNNTCEFFSHSPVQWILIGAFLFSTNISNIRYTRVEIIFS